MPDDTTTPVTADPCWLCQDLGAIAVHNLWTKKRGEGKPPLWTAHAPTSRSHPVYLCPVCRPAVPVAAEGLRERLERAELASEVVRALDGNVSVVSHSNRTAADRAVAVLAGHVGAPGDLPARMAEAIGTIIHIDPETHREIAEAAMSVRWEAHAATLAERAQLRAERDHAVGELSARGDHETRWQAEHARAERLQAELAELKAGIAEAVRQIRAWQDPESAEPLLDHVHVPEVERTLKAYIGEHVIAALEGRTADPEEIRRLIETAAAEEDR